MTVEHAPPARPMVRPFPTPGRLVQIAYHELDIAARGDDDAKKKLGPISQLPRPWAPATCTDPDLRDQLWQWLDDVVVWLNHEYTWDTHALIPYCWPGHPHLVHEIAVIADQRRRAGLALTSEPLEEWHRYCLPPFIDRMRNRVRAHCDDAHKPWPGTPIHNEHIGEDRTQRRENIFARDLDSVTAEPDRTRHLEPVDRNHAVDRATGELHDYEAP